MDAVGRVETTDCAVHNVADPTKRADCITGAGGTADGAVVAESFGVQKLVAETGCAHVEVVGRAEGTVVEAGSAIGCACEGNEARLTGVTGSCPRDVTLETVSGAGSADSGDGSVAEDAAQGIG